MLHDPLVIDTCALRHKDFLAWLVHYRGRKILPSIAYCEFCFYMIVIRNKSIGDANFILKCSGIEVEDFTKNLGSLVAYHCREMEDPDFRENWRDFMIGAHASIAPIKLITDNIEDFSFLGDRVFEPHDFMKQARS